MPEWLEVELALIPVALAALGGLIWLIRLEAQGHQNRDTLADMKVTRREDRKRRQEHDDKLWDEFRVQSRVLYLIAGKLGVTID